MRTGDGRGGKRGLFSFSFGFNVASRLALHHYWRWNSGETMGGGAKNTFPTWWRGILRCVFFSFACVQLRSSQMCWCVWGPWDPCCELPWRLLNTGGRPTLDSTASLSRRFVWAAVWTACLDVSYYFTVSWCPIFVFSVRRRLCCKRNASLFEKTRSFQSYNWTLYTVSHVCNRLQSSPSFVLVWVWAAAWGAHPAGSEVIVDVVNIVRGLLEMQCMQLSL